MAARRGSQWVADFERNLRKLERQLPAPVRRVLRQLVQNLREAQRQLETARAEREVRWQKLATQLRGDAAQLVRQLQQAVGPSRSSARRSSARRGARKGARRSRKK